jgi:hypothetical protein
LHQGYTIHSERRWGSPDRPFNMLISGITGCGKAHNVFDLLENEIKIKFDCVTIFCLYLHLQQNVRQEVHVVRALCLCAGVNGQTR